MTIVLQLDSSVTGTESVTNRLNTLTSETVGADATIIRRDLTALPTLTADIFAANNTPSDDRTPEQSELAALADELIAELESADVIVIGAPIYNFGVPSSLKAWMDLVARAGRTFRYGDTGPEGLVNGKQAYVVTASGGVPVGSEADFASGHITTFLYFLGFTDVTQIEAGGLMMDPTKINDAEAQIRQLAPA